MQLENRYEPEYAVSFEGVVAPEGMIQSLIQADAQKMSAWISYVRHTRALEALEEEFERLTGRDPHEFMAQWRSQQKAAAMSTSEMPPPLDINRHTKNLRGAKDKE